MTAPVEICIAAARLFRPWDGDSGDLLVNFRRRGTWRTAQVCGVRLKGYRAREKWQDAETNPGTGEIVRVDGKEAGRITTSVLLNAALILVEFTGLNDREREVCHMWVQQTPGAPLDPLGEVLMARRVVLPGDTMGTRQ